MRKPNNNALKTRALSVDSTMEAKIFRETPAFATAMRVQIVEKLFVENTPKGILIRLLGPTGDHIVLSFSITDWKKLLTHSDFSAGGKSAGKNQRF